MGCSKGVQREVEGSNLRGFDLAIRGADYCLCTTMVLRFAYNSQTFLSEGFHFQKSGFDVPVSCERRYNGDTYVRLAAFFEGAFQVMA